ncbi:MAG: hypothetical protein JAY90_22835 [Candidatus Thiodiazotropha lotti]|nr:hypothetical protein [Candidatus Thiodiazotropha lotti]
MSALVADVTFDYLKWVTYLGKVVYRPIVEDYEAGHQLPIYAYKQT